MKVAVFGDREIVLPFKALGLDIYPYEGGKPEDTLNELIQKGYIIIFVTEDIINKIKDQKILYLVNVNIVIIPGHGRGEGIGMKKIREIVKKAVGVDLGGEK